MSQALPLLRAADRGDAVDQTNRALSPEFLVPALDSRYGVWHDVLLNIAPSLKNV
ncbi:hypothetical protein OC834_006054 [Tilletia horrida]|nr:hypothetical protein OC834_006054 [Tilletia horrida]